MKKLLLTTLLLTTCVLSSQNSAFTQSAVTNSPYTKSSGCIGDFNNDGKIDYIQNLPNNNTIFTQIAGGFSVTNTPTTSTYPCGTISGDFNNDGNLDFIDMNTSPLKIVVGLGNGTFSVQTSNQNGGIVEDAISLDINSDGNLDIICSPQGTTGITVLTGNGNGMFNSPTIIPSSPGAFSILSGDFNNDSNKDISFVFNSGFGISLGNGNGTFNTPVTYTLASVWAGVISNGDFNNDGNLDIAFGTPYASNITIYFGNGSGTFSTTSTIPSNQIIGLTSGDFNGDSKIDLVSIDKVFPSNSVNFHFNNGTTNLYSLLSYSISSPMGVNFFDSFFAVDLNNNSKLDLAICTYSTTMNSLFLISNENCIYPGDANSDGIANNNDILELGLHMGLTGAARTPTSNAWNSFTCTPWTGTITTGKNMNHSDCNGDGTINLSDTLAVFNNYGFMHSLKESAPTATPQISIVPDQAIVFKNNWGTASIYVGDASTPVNNINGVAFTVSFNKTLIQPDSVYIEYIPSFINSNNLHFRKRIFSNGEIYTATTHTVNNNVSGNGKIAILHYKIKPNLVSDSTLNLGIIKASKMDASGNLSSLTSGSGTLTASASALGLTEFNSDASIIIYPNPNNGIVTIASSQSLLNSELFIYNSLGQEVFQTKLTNQQQTLNLNLAKGIYSYKIQQPNKLVKQNKIVIE